MMTDKAKVAIATDPEMVNDLSVEDLYANLDDLARILAKKAA